MKIHVTKVTQLSVLAGYLRLLRGLASLLREKFKSALFRHRIGFLQRKAISDAERFSLTLGADLFDLPSVPHEKMKNLQKSWRILAARICW